MTKSKYLISPFNICGNLQDFIIKSGDRIKYLKITISQNSTEPILSYAPVQVPKHYWIKVPKKLRNNLSKEIRLGCNLELSGHKKQSCQDGKIKWEAEQIRVVSIENQSRSIECINKYEEKPSTLPQASVLVCGKSTCWKRGGKTVCQMLEENLRDRGLEGQVKIKTTGCLKQCKNGPNLVMMPDKARYSQVQPKQVAELLEKHLIG